MQIEIKARFNNNCILFSVEAENVKKALELAVKQGADLRDANLRGADLWDANLRDAALQGADLRGADLWGANLRGANLRDAALRGADLRSAKHYKNSHCFFGELVRQQKLDNFTDAEWSIIGQITIHSLCWHSIAKRFGKDIIPIFSKLAQNGFDEFLKHYEEVLKQI